MSDNRNNKNSKTEPCLWLPLIIVVTIIIMTKTITLMSTVTKTI